MARTFVLPTDPDKREWALRAELKGKALLAEVPFDQKQCDVTARFFAKVISWKGADPGRRLIVESWPVMFALWLTNEAFFNFVGAKYWPFVLEKLGIDSHNAYSSRFGKGFLDILERFKLPQFKRLKTRWSYLGPILAHSGIPRSCLPEYFEKVVPRAIELGASSRAGFETLQESLPGMHLPRATEWFVLFGDAVAEDFVRRSVELFRAKADTQDTAAVAERLPLRVVEEFETWWASEPAASRVMTNGPRPRRPVLTFDQLDGLRLALPSQSCGFGESAIVWRLQSDRAVPVDLLAQRLPGQSQTEPREATFAEPFAVLTVRLIESGVEKGLWAFAGVSQAQPVLFFEPDSGSVLHRSTVDASVLGVVHPSGTHIVGFRGQERSRPRVVASLGQLRFGWRSFEATVIDCAGSDELSVRAVGGETVWRGELREMEATAPRLLPAGADVSRSRDGMLVFTGAAPVLEITAQSKESRQSTLARWSVRVRPIGDGASANEMIQVGLGDPSLTIDEQDGDSYRISLGQPRLLGPCPWGVFEVSALGPMGRDASFRCVVRPHVEVTHDWKSWKQHDELAIQLRVPAAARLIGAMPSADPRVFSKKSSGHPINLTLVTIGYGNSEWSLPLDVQVPIPSWSLYEPEHHRPLLEWTSKPLRVSLGELEGRGTTLLLRGGTPAGVPQSAEVTLRGAAGALAQYAVRLDKQGCCSVDLAPCLAAARQTQAARVDLEVGLLLPQQRVVLQVAQLERDWRPEDLSARVSEESIELRWKERFPIEGRAVHATNLLQPWNAPVSATVAPADRGVLTLKRHDFDPGWHRLAIGIQDDWTGEFRERGFVDVQLGGLSECRRHPLFSEQSADGMLYRLLLAHRAGETGVATVEDADGCIQPRSGSAEKILRACLALGAGNQGDAVATRLGRLLRQLPLGEILEATAALEGAVTPEALLGLRLFTRPTAMSSVLPRPETLEALWRIWPPLGAWAEMRCLESGDGGAEKRLERAFGAQSLHGLSPVTAGGRVRVFGVLPDQPLKCRLTSVLAGNGQDAFSIRRLESPAVLMVETHMPDFPLTALALSRGPQGWMLQAPGDAVLPEPLAAAAEAEQGGISVIVYYPRSPLSCHPAPELQIVAIVNAGNAATLRALADHCSPLPVGPIGGDAFRAACFDWATRAASDRSARMHLVELCRQIALPRVREVSTSWGKAAASNSEAWDRHVLELVARGDSRAEHEPLLAMHQLTWMTAMALVCRGLGRPLPFMWSEPEIIATALALQQYAPKLLEHDLALVCAIETLAAANCRSSLDGPSKAGESDAA